MVHARHRRPRLRRGVTAVLVLAVPVAALLDCGRAPFGGAIAAVAWLDLIALACVAWAALTSRAPNENASEGWSTPFDGLLLALLALAAVGAAGERGAGQASTLLQHAVGCTGAFFGLAFVLRRTPGSGELVWRTIALVAAALGAHALWAATGGLDALARQSHAVDAHWSGTHGLARMLGFATLLTAGRAAERGAGAPWRLACLVGVMGLVVHVASGGLALDALSLARLDAPLDFSTACITWMLCAALARSAWALRKERRDEAWRWRAMTIAASGMGVASVLGAGGSGEGVRAVSVLAATALMAAPARVAAGREGVQVEAPELERAA